MRAITPCSRGLNASAVGSSETDHDSLIGNSQLSRFGPILAITVWSNEGAPIFMETQRKEIASLRAAHATGESQLLALLRTAVQIVWVMDAHGRIPHELSGNGELAELTWSAFTGLQPDQVQGVGWMSAMHPSDVKSFETALSLAQQNGEALDTEFRVRHRDGRWRSMACRGEALRDADGQIIGWNATCVDVTRIRLAEAAHKEAEDRLLAALDAGEMCTWIWQANNQKFYWDATGGRLWGLENANLPEAAFSDLRQYIHPDDREATLRAAELTAATGIFHSAEFRIVRPDGRPQWLQSRGRVERDAKGRVVRVVGVFIDVTKVKFAEESLRQTQKLQALGTLAGGIAHDFNSLVLVISGNAQLALSDLEPPHPARTSLQEISKAAVRAGDLVRRILTFAARQAPAEAVTPVQPAVHEALKLLTSAVPPHVRIQTQLRDNTVACTLGQTELEQVVVNLVTNAIHAIGEREGTIDIQVDLPSTRELPAGLRPENSYVRLSVRDNGSGMTAETRLRIFEPFFTTKPKGKGTGLGLAVVHGIVTGSGGTIVVESEVGRGTTFQVWLQIAAPGEPSDEEKNEPARVPEPREHVLFVDDDEAIAYLIQRVLERMGYRVTCSPDPRDAIELFRKHGEDIDVVVTDLTMPVMNGFDLALALREIRADVPIVMTSGYARDEDQQRAVDLGIGRIILKPDTVELLGQELDLRCATLREARARKTPDL